jgi:hypothetical protein
MRYYKVILFVFINIILCQTFAFADGPVSIHVIVSLCDNKHQAIVPVPEKLGNGSDPVHNLYWGALYGMKTYFKKSSHWNLIHSESKINKSIIERIVFKHTIHNAYLVADAYYGHAIDRAIYNVIASVYGAAKEQVPVNINTSLLNIGIGGNADLIAYIGHNGLMEFSYQLHLKRIAEEKREFIILACKSKDYFLPYLRDSGAEPLLWTTGFMAPEAYVLEDSLEGWLRNESKEQIRIRAAKSYHHYQHCGLSAAKKLFVTTW